MTRGIFRETCFYRRQFLVVKYRGPDGIDDRVPVTILLRYEALWGG